MNTVAGRECAEFAQGRQASGALGSFSESAGFSEASLEDEHPLLCRPGARVPLHARTGAAFDFIDEDLSRESARFEHWIDVPVESSI